MVFCNVVRLSCPAQTCIQKGTLFTLKWYLILQRFPVLLFLFWFSCCYCHRSCRLRYRRGGSVFATATWFQAGKMSLTRESNVAECIKRRLIKMCLKFNRSVVRLGLTSLVSCRRFSQFMTLRHKVWTRRYWWAGRGAGDAGDFSETPTFHLWRPCDCEILMKYWWNFASIVLNLSRSTFGNKEFQKIARPPQSWQQLQHSWRRVQVNLGWCGVVYEFMRVAMMTRFVHTCP